MSSLIRFSRFDVPGRLNSNPVLRLAAAAGLWPVRQCQAAVKSQIKAPGQGLSHALARRAARDCDVVVATYDELIGFGLEDMAGKTLVTSSISDERLNTGRSRRGYGAGRDATAVRLHRVDSAVLEALMLAVASDAAGRTDQ